MVFKSRKENGGEIDPNINREGPKKKEGKKTRRQVRNQELIMLLRKVKPHVATAIFKASEIMKDEKASHQSQLKAATILLDNYKTLLGDLYGKDIEDDEDNEPQEIQPKGPVFSLTVVGGNEE